jgi:imidazolonepropionase-like amidohydrolase
MNAILLRSMLLISAACVPSVALGAPASGDKLVIEAGRILTQAGDEIENGVIVIENGRITAIGKAEDVKKPWDAPVIGGPDRVAFPGFVEAHTSMGMDRANENVEVAPS